MLDCHRISYDFFLIFNPVSQYVKVLSETSALVSECKDSITCEKINALNFTLVIF